VIELHGNTTYAAVSAAGRPTICPGQSPLRRVRQRPRRSVADESGQDRDHFLRQAMPEDEMRRPRTRPALRPVPGRSDLAGGLAGRGFPLMAKNCGAIGSSSSTMSRPNRRCCDLVIRHESENAWTVCRQLIRMIRRPARLFHSSRQNCFLAMRHMRECYLLIREIRAGVS